MKVVIQRVKNAKVVVEEKLFSSIESTGLLVYFAAAKDDNEKCADYLSEKISGLRIFEDEKGKMNLSVNDVQGSIMIVPEFTLYGDCGQGKRPGFDKSAPPEKAEKLFHYFIKKIREKCPHTETGKFRADMQVHSINDGPVTFIIEKS